MENKTKPLNIALICDSIDDITGGSFESVRRFSSKLKERGHKIILITTKNTSDTKESDRFKDDIVYRFFSSFPFGSDKFRFILLKQSTLEEILKKHNVDIIYAIHPIYSGYIAIQCARKLNLPIVMHMHLQAENLANNNSIMIKANNILYRYFSMFYNRSDIVICPSDFGKELLRRHKIHTPVEVISNGVNLNEYKKLETSKIEYLYKKYPIQRNRFNMIMVSRLVAEKSIDTAIAAMPEIVSKNKTAQLIIIGGGALFAKLSAQIQKLKMQDYIVLLGRVPAEDMVPLINLGKLFVHPSLIELEGMVILEAMACGLPLLVADAKSSASASLVDGNGEIFKALDSRDLANKAIQLFSSPSKLELMSRTSLQNIRKYNMDTSIDRLEVVFNSAIEKVKNRKKIQNASTLLFILSLITLILSWFFISKEQRARLFKYVTDLGGRITGINNDNVEVVKETVKEK
jgi:1,2-diacylglycerol 3-alpha-glucosyltransferase